MASGSLTVKQKKAIGCLLRNTTIEAAARCAGITRSTLHRYLTDDDFIAELQTHLDGVVNEGARMLSVTSVDAIEALGSLMQSEDERIQLAACNSVLRYMVKFYELKNITDRLERLERELHVHPNGIGATRETPGPTI